jgi:quercetin 2,3-dioxygenase
MTMSRVRAIAEVWRSQPTREGAGVHLKRAFGFRHAPRLDPFLLLDDFRSDHPSEYSPGFPWHPHRGIETITYMLAGRVEHGDSLGNEGVIAAGDVQWMTAGSGIIHQEMPKGDAAGRMGGFQLWANLPASQKMMEPRYREVKRSQIPEARLAGDVRVKVICGDVGGVQGPVRDIVTDPAYLDVAMPAGTRFVYGAPAGYTALVYIVEGSLCCDRHGETAVDADSVVLFGDGDELVVSTRGDGGRFLFFSGRPIGEPVAWYGPIVMNTQEELRLAFDEVERGTFLKHART